MISFESDYIMGAHPSIFEKLIETNMEALSGYGADKYTIAASEKIKAACGYMKPAPLNIQVIRFCL